MKKYKTADQVKDTLKLAALHNKVIAINSVKQPTWRSIGGPFKSKLCEFSSNRYRFDVLGLHATSCGWWSMLKVIRGKLVRNSYGYSPQTSKHQSMLDKALKVLNIKPDIVVYTRANIEYLTGWKHEILRRYAEAFRLYSRCRANSKPSYKRYLRRIEKEMAQLTKARIGLRFTKKDKLAAIASEEQRHNTKLLNSKKQKENKQRQEMPKAVNDSACVKFSFNNRNVRQLTLVK